MLLMDYQNMLLECQELLSDAEDPKHIFDLTILKHRIQAKIDRYKSFNETMFEELCRSIEEYEYDPNRDHTYIE